MSAPVTDVEELVELSRLLVSVAHRSLRTAGDPVSLQQFRAMAVLDREGPQSSTSLAEALDLHPSSVSRLVDRLVELGLVSRVVRLDDRRVVQLDLTRSGQRVVERVFAARARDIERVLARIPAARRRTLALLLPELVEAASRALPEARLGWAG